MLKDAHPTDQSVRQTEEKKIREQKLAKQALSAAEVKAARESKMFHQEVRQDDCGYDLRPSVGIPMTTAFVADGGLGSAIVCQSVIDSIFCSVRAESSEDELEMALNDNISLHYLVVSGGSGRYLNKVVHPDAWRRSRQIFEISSKFAAQVCNKCKQTDIST